MGNGGGDHVHKLGLISGGHHHHAGQVRQKRHVKGPGMGRPIRADKPGTVDGKAHGKALDRHVMHHLIIAALQEGGIDRAKGLHPPSGKARAEGDGVLFGDANIEEAFGKTVGKEVQPGAIRHSSRHGNDPVVARRLGHQRLRKDLGIGRRI